MPARERARRLGWPTRRRLDRRYLLPSQPRGRGQLVRPACGSRWHRKFRCLSGSVSRAGRRVHAVRGGSPLGLAASLWRVVTCERLPPRFTPRPGSGPDTERRLGAICTTAQFAAHRDGSQDDAPHSVVMLRCVWAVVERVGALDNGTNRSALPSTSGGGQSPRSPVWRRPSDVGEQLVRPRPSAWPDLFAVGLLPWVSESGDLLLACAEPGKLLEQVVRPARRLGDSCEWRSACVRRVWCDLG